MGLAFTFDHIIILSLSYYIFIISYYHIIIISCSYMARLQINLVAGKSRVAPVKELSMPRLELCAASLLKKLYIEVKTQFEFDIDRTILWSDSTIVLCWLKKAPHLLRTFELNRFADIQSLGDQVIRRYVQSKHNPADTFSRGEYHLIFPKILTGSLGPLGSLYLKKNGLDRQDILSVNYLG